MGVIGSQSDGGQATALHHQRQGEPSDHNGQQSQSSNQHSLTHADLWHWLVDHCVPRHKMLNSYLMCIGRKVLGQVDTSLIWIIKTESHSHLNNFQAWATLQTQNHLDEVGAGKVPLRKDPSTLQKYTVNFPPRPPQKVPTAFYQSTCTLGIRKWSNLLGTTGYWLWTDTDSRRPKTSLWPRSQSRDLWRPGDQWSFSSSLIHSGSSVFPNPPCGYLPSSRMHNWNRHT